MDERTIVPILRKFLHFSMLLQFILNELYPYFLATLYTFNAQEEYIVVLPQQIGLFLQATSKEGAFAKQRVRKEYMLLKSYTPLVIE
jgi:hypothetical protein